MLSNYVHQLIYILYLNICGSVILAYLCELRAYQAVLLCIFSVPRLSRVLFVMEMKYHNIYYGPEWANNYYSTFTHCHAQPQPLQ